MLSDLKKRLRPNRIHVFPPEDVTSIGEREEAPGSGGLTASQVEEIWDSVVRFYETGLHPSLALCIRRNGRVVVDRAIGHSHGNTPAGPSDDLRAATPDTLYNLFSASKPMTAMLIHHLDEKNKLRIDDRVADYIPEFAKNGKEKVTIRHILSHRAGLALIPPENMDLDILVDEQKILRLLCDAYPDTVPGRKQAYHALSGGFILGEIIKRVSGKPIREYLDEVIRKPLKMTSFQYGVPAEKVRDVAKDVFTGPGAFFPLSLAVRRAFGAPIDEAVALASDPRFLTGVVPSGNLICTPNEASMFFECLLRGGKLNNRRIFAETTVNRAVLEQSYHEHDAVLQYPFRFGNGFMLGSDRSSVLGPDTPEAFGHMGFTNILVYADPERDISVALLNNGKPFIAVESVWWLNIARTITRTIPKM
ncbi:MAG: CubicO group peptidase (beta-lactamase class C family) [Bradymonadia bacterium]|jgi:CubicO group peptidase (beta-lactamase class C family)